MKAIVLIKLETGELKSAVRDLRSIHGVDEAHLTFGPFDAVARIEAEDLNHIGRIVEHEIQPIPGVIKTLTCLMVEGELPIPDGQGEAGSEGEIDLVDAAERIQYFGVN